MDQTFNDFDIAVIGMSCILPGISNTHEFWNALINNKELVSEFSKEELIKAGINAKLLNDPNYRRFQAVIEDKHCFDTTFFDYSPVEAQFLDPQIRILHACAWETMQDGGYDPFDYDGFIGLFCGASSNFAWEASALLNKNAKFNNWVAHHLVDKDYISSRISYCFDLKGPSVTLYTGCSTSLVSVHMASQSLITGESDMALAGGVSIAPRDKYGYLYQEGMVYSRDGKCRTFDSNASGIVGGEGAGMVMLKLLKRAIEDGDYIHGIIKGSAINNDGRKKMNFSAPSSTMQADVIRMAHNISGIHPDTISYIEAHGTGTKIGDPIEIKALNDAFNTSRKQFCAIGSVKTNVGHLDVAAGVIGLIKTVLALENKIIPASLHYQEANPEIDFKNSPFYVNGELRDWKTKDKIRRAGVSSFGIGGTNVHVILEEYVREATSSDTDQINLFKFSAKGSDSLKSHLSKVYDFLNENNEINLNDLAYTLSNYRKKFSKKIFFVANNSAELLSKIKDTLENESEIGNNTFKNPGVIFMFTGAGIQYVNMAKDLYKTNSRIRAVMDECFKILRQYSVLDFESLLFRETDKIEYIKHSHIAMPLIFLVEYSIAIFLMEIGIKPQGMIGHSLGEYTAACLSGVITLEDALMLVVRRGELFNSIHNGGMLSIFAGVEELKLLIEEHDLSIAAINTIENTVVSGKMESIQGISESLNKLNIDYRHIKILAAGHSKLIEPLADDFRKITKTIEHFSPKIPYVSNITGDWVTSSQLKNTEYWCEHLLKPVQFLDGVKTILKNGHDNIFLEIGPGNVLASFVDTICEDGNYLTLGTLRHPKNPGNDVAFLLHTLGELWRSEISIEWEMLFRDRECSKISFPSYSFNKIAYDNLSAELDQVEELFGPDNNDLERRNQIDNWFYSKTWRQIKPTIELVEIQYNNYIVFTCSPNGLNKDLRKSMNRRLKPLHFIDIEDDFNLFSEKNQSKLKVIRNNPKLKNKKNKIICLFGFDNSYDPKQVNINTLQHRLLKNLYIVLDLIRVLASSESIDYDLDILLNNSINVAGNEPIDPIKVTTIAAAKIISVEYPDIGCRIIDIDRLTTVNETLLFNEIQSNSKQRILALRGDRKWSYEMQPIEITQKVIKDNFFAKDKTYVILGGLGGMGLNIAEFIATKYSSKIVIINRSDIPEPEVNDANNEVNKKIEKINIIKEHASLFKFFKCDISNLETFKQAIDSVLNDPDIRCINGIIHAAGIIDYGGIIQKRKNEEIEEIISNKVHAVLYLQNLIDFSQLDFITFFSSRGNILYGAKFGQVAYNVANEFLEGYSEYLRYNFGIKAITINWCDWKETGMLIKAIKGRNKANNELNLYEDIEDSLSNEEGKAVFERIINTGISGITVSTRDLNGLIKIMDEKLSEKSFELEDRKQTVTSLKTRPELSTEYIAPSNILEEKIAAIWQSNFGYDKIGIHDDYFEMGGDSLKGMKFIKDYQKLLNERVPVAIIFKAPSIKQTALHFKKHYMEHTEFKTEGKFGNQKSGRISLEIKPVEKKEYYPASPSQFRLFFLQNRYPNTKAYNLYSTFLIKGVLDKDRLAEAFRELIRKNEILRTSFHVINKKVCQVIENVNNIPGIEFHSAKEIDLQNLLQNLDQQFDLKTPPVKLYLIEINPQETILFGIIHHILIDGNSKPVLFKQLMDNYFNAASGVFVYQVKDYVNWLALLEQSEQFERMEQYWRNKSHTTIPLINLPIDFPRKEKDELSGDILQITLPDKLSAYIDDYLKTKSISPTILYYSFFWILMHKLSKQDDIVTGIGISINRIDQMIGMFVNTVPFRFKTSPDITFDTFLSQITNEFVETYDNSLFPLEKIVQLSKVSRQAGRNPLFDVEFTYHQIGSKKELEKYKEMNIEVEYLEILPPKKYPNFDLHMDVVKKDNTIDIELNYSTDLFKKETVQNFLTEYQSIVKQVISNPGISIRDIKCEFIPQKNSEINFSL